MSFDVVWSYSLWTHLPYDKVAKSLSRVRGVIADHGVFLATYFECPEGADCDGPVRQPWGITSFPDRDPWHYSQTDLARAASDAGFRVAEFLGEWQEPAEQKMAAFYALEPGEVGVRTDI